MLDHITYFVRVSVLSLPKNIDRTKAYPISLSPPLYGRFESSDMSIVLIASER